ncbi:MULTISPECIES: hypothetical protein, partial [unclassified Clostridium]|uniref:hypothetical protein n=1 Tax=unclassified Clostridium TaxID=2614128 RepID=UPI001A9B3F17
QDQTLQFNPFIQAGLRFLSPALWLFTQSPLRFRFPYLRQNFLLFRLFSVQFSKVLQTTIWGGFAPRFYRSEINHTRLTIACQPKT